MRRKMKGGILEAIAIRLAIYTPCLFSRFYARMRSFEKIGQAFAYPLCITDVPISLASKEDGFSILRQSRLLDPLSV